MFRVSCVSVNFSKVVVMFLFLITGIEICSICFPATVYSAVPAIDLNGWGVVTKKTSNSMPQISIGVKIYDHDGISIDGSSHKVEVLFPDGKVYPLDFDRLENSYSALYGTWMYVNAPVSGDYIIRVKDLKENITTQIIDRLDVKPISLIDETSLRPSKEEVVADTVPTFSWSRVNDSYLYIVVIFDSISGNVIWQGNAENRTSYTIPPGILNSDTDYYYYIETRDNHDPLETDNVSQTPSIPIHFKTGELSLYPYIERASDDGFTTYEGNLSFWLKIHDIEGVPNNIESVKVKLPDGNIISLLYDSKNVYNYNSTTCGVYYLNLASSTQEGTYKLTVRDIEKREYSISKYLTPAWMEHISRSEAAVNGTGINFEWENVAEAKIYRVEIYSADDTAPAYTFHSTVTQYQLPPGILEADKNYRYKITAQKEFYDEILSNTSSSSESSFHTVKDVVSVVNNKAIIVAGGGPYEGNSLWNATMMNTDYAYKALIRQGYSKDTVYYLSPVSNYDLDGNGKYDDVDADATNSNFGYAIRTWASDAKELFIYMVDHGGDGTFRMNKNETLRAETLNQWLDAFQTNNPVRIVLVYDACRAGSFLPLLKSSSGKERILAASTSSDTEAVFASDGKGSYSFIFWAGFSNGESFYDSLTGAKKTVGLIYPKQVSQIDANGNGIPNEKEDLVLAKNVRIGNETTFAADIPTIGSVSPEQMLNNQTSAAIYAKDIVSTADIGRVWAVITPPDYSSATKDTPVTNLPTIDLLPAGNGRYEATYRGFDTVGTYNIAVFATDKNGEVSLPVQTSVFRNSCIPVGNDLALHLCAEYLGEKYGFTMNYTPNPKDTAGLYWKMDTGTFGSLSADTGNCLIVNEDLDMNLCGGYQGHNYAFTMNFYLNPYDISGLYWKMDLATFREIQ